MDELIGCIFERLREEAQGGARLDDAELSRLLRERNKREGGGRQGSAGWRFAKKDLVPAYRDAKASRPDAWRAWGVTPQLEEAFLHLARVKPGRTASGVATITVLTKPWPCGGACVFCPADVRMPKSYLSREPACQRAERNRFDPYLQVAARLSTLADMGHDTRAIELIVLGGTWDDYPEGYRAWFAACMLRALNDAEDARRAECARLRTAYDIAGIPANEAACAKATRAVQQRVDAGKLTYNQAVRELYGAGGAAGDVASAPCALAEGGKGESPLRLAWEAIAKAQVATWEDVARELAGNERAQHRLAGLSLETRPDCVSPESLRQMLACGCTRVQMGVQTLHGATARGAGRAASPDTCRHALELARAQGFQLHAHFMVNLPGATPGQDMSDYRALVEDGAAAPDEVKLYPCVMVGSARLCGLYGQGLWRPYGEDELLDVLAADVRATPPYVRISRMIRDISSNDILAGNKKVNLRQAVDTRIAAEAAQGAAAPCELRGRERRGKRVEDAATLTLEAVPYGTPTAREFFLQLMDDVGKVAAYLRLSLPHATPRALIREVHAGAARPGVQQAMAARLIEAAEAQAQQAGHGVIAAIRCPATACVFRSRGYVDDGFYLRKDLG